MDIFTLGRVLELVNSDTPRAEISQRILQEMKNVNDNMEAVAGQREEEEKQRWIAYSKDNPDGARQMRDDVLFRNK